METNRGRSLVGKVSDHARRKGWFFGAFMDEPLLQSDLVEIAWQRTPDLTPEPEQRHFHRQTVEVNVLLRGWMNLSIDGVEQRVEAGGFYVIWPESVVSDITTGSDTEVMVIRAPSVPGDKVVVESN